MLSGKNTFHWILRGLIWGLLMFMGMAIAIPYAEGVPLHSGNVFVKFLIWMVGGLIYGYTFHWIESKKD